MTGVWRDGNVRVSAFCIDDGGPSDSQKTHLNSSRGNHVHEIICGDRQLFVNNLLVLVHDISICSEDKTVGRRPHELYDVRLH